ncbi:MAG: XisI protein [Leptospiraceae bacterium]|nr:XisI protein [Leptospiraceae bacterium]
MDKIEKYRQNIIQLLENHSNIQPLKQEDIETQIIIDSKNDHYQLLSIGWKEDERIFGCIFHFDIKNGKIWIQRNMSDIQLAKELEGMGVPKSDIVLGLQPPSMRKFTEYAYEN